MSFNLDDANIGGQLKVGTGICPATGEGATFNCPPILASSKLNDIVKLNYILFGFFDHQP